MLSERCPVPSVLSVTLVYSGQTIGRIKMKLGMQVGLGPGHIALDGDPAPPTPKKGHSAVGPCLLRPNGWVDLDATWYGGRPRPKRLCVRWEPSFPPPKKREQSLNFRPMCVVAKRLDGLIFNMPLGMEVGLGPGDFVLDGDPNKKGDTAPQFSAQMYCGQTARWIKMPLGSEVGLVPCDIVLDGIEIPNKKGEQPPVFGPCLFWPNGWMHQDTTWYGGRPQTRRHCVRCGPAPSPQKGDTPLQFWPMSIVAIGSPILATAELL